MIFSFHLHEAHWLQVSGSHSKMPRHRDRSRSRSRSHSHVYRQLLAQSQKKTNEMTIERAKLEAEVKYTSGVRETESVIGALHPNAKEMTWCMPGMQWWKMSWKTMPSESSTFGQKPAKLWKRQQRFAKSNKNERSACCRTTSTKFWHIPKLLRMHAVSVRALVRLAKLWTATLWMKQTICRITRRRWSASHADIYSIGAVTRVTWRTTRSQTAVWFAALLRRSGLAKRRSTLLAWHWTSRWCFLNDDFVDRMTWPARRKATVW